jgi:hypothetical protein
MGIGTSSETIRITGTAAGGAFDRATAAMAKVGKVIEVDPQDRFLRGSTRYGLQKVRLKITIEQDGADSLVTIDALADDVWGKGARSGIEKLRNALEE